MSQHRLKRYSRVRVHDYDDIKMLFSLLVDIVQDPELALSINEIVFRANHPSQEMYYYKTNRPEILRTQENNRDISQEHLMFQAVECLDLEQAERLKWVRILTWMKPELVEARELALAGDERSFEIEPFYECRNIWFAHHASALLLILCPNIVSLVYEDCSRTVADVLRRNNYGLLPEKHLQKLRSVTLLPTTDATFGDKRFYINLDILSLLRLFHRLPVVESLSVDGAGQSGNFKNLDKFPPAISHLKRIHVGHAFYSTSVIGSLIRVPRRLEEFTLTTGGRGTGDGRSFGRGAKTIGKALLEQKSSLRKIDIDIDEYNTQIGRLGGGEDGDEDEDEEDDNMDEWFRKDEDISTGPLKISQLPNTREYRSTIGSMHDFESLTHLSIGIKLLLGGSVLGREEEDEDAPFRLIEALPKSLEYLLIRGYSRGINGRYDSQIDEFLSQKDDRLPLLTELHGIEEIVPSAKSVEKPDKDKHLLWKMKKMDDDWIEVDV